MAPTTIWGLIVFCVMIWGFVCKFRASNTPGAVLIRLAGRFKGKVVVFLKQLASGLLWVTGLFKISGVSIHRVNQANLIATSTKVDISRTIADKCGTLELEEEEKNVLPQEKKGDQKAMDAALLKSIEAVPDLEVLKNQIDSVMVVAAVIMTVAFKTGLIVAGRYMRDGLLEILSSSALYEAFTISIILAFLLSCYAVLNLFCTKHLLHRREDIIDPQLNVAKFCTLSAIFAMIVAFGSSVVLAIAITDH